MSRRTSDHHAVRLPGGTSLTRLPIGHADGHSWIFFVVTGKNMMDWHLADHVRIERDGSQAVPLEGGSTGSDTRALSDVVIAGGPSGITINYFHGAELVDSEHFDE